MKFVNNDSKIVPFALPLRSVAKENPLQARIMRCFSEMRYLNTYKALHLGGEMTLESKLIRSALTKCATHSEKETAERLSNYHTVSKSLSELKREDLLKLLEGATLMDSGGTGGEVYSINVEGIPLIMKKIPLSATELKHPKSTQNLFNLPSFYQYGVWSYGFSTWRELASHEMTTQWVLKGKCQNFPLMYHWTVLNRPLSLELTKKQKAETIDHVKCWNGSSAVERRALEKYSAPADVLLFMEQFPMDLGKWIHLEGGRGNLQESSLKRIEQELNHVLIFMKSKGFLHLDAHFGNVFASDNHIYFGDFGLALSSKFDLSLEESAFLLRHQDYDRNLVMTELAMAAISATFQKESNDFMDAVPQSKEKTSSLSPAVESLAKKYAPVATLMIQFLRELKNNPSKNTVYPKMELDREWKYLK